MRLYPDRPADEIRQLILDRPTVPVADLARLCGITIQQVAGTGPPTRSRPSGSSARSTGAPPLDRSRRARRDNRPPVAPRPRGRQGPYRAPSRRNCRPHARKPRTP
jgi:hypothetical protein